MQMRTEATLLITPRQMYERRRQPITWQRGESDGKHGSVNGADLNTVGHACTGLGGLND